ncbi:MAG: DUF4263 domain-containing protein [Candidatus Nealsonbacteria bacterium]|nr:DUF4263 domain-containing protein [Candidatus Nealsonbacteria bacterium]
MLAAERRYWARHDQLVRTFEKNAEIAGIPALQPMELVTRVFGFRDACVLVRFKRVANCDFQVVDIDEPSSQWRDFVTIPVQDDGDTVEVRTGRCFGLGGICVNCSISFGDLGPYEIPYLQTLKCEYSENPEFEDAIHDLSVTIVGALAHRRPTTEQDVLGRLEKLLADFRELLDQTAADNSKEEVLQVFLKEHPLVLTPHARLIPKQKLGEDFCTDFVLIDMLDQGPRYTLVEIEKSSHEVFTKNGELRSEVHHAIHQTCEWDSWLQKHSGYVREKLQGFESPQYMVVIGRSTKFTDGNREYLRAYNRRLNDTQLITYDDVAELFEDRIAAMRAYFSPATP